MAEAAIELIGINKSFGAVRANRDINKIASEPVVKSSSAKEVAAEEEADKPKKGGWWQRRGFF